MHSREPINTIYKLDIDVVNPAVEPTFSFITIHDGMICMGPADIDVTQWIADRANELLRNGHVVL